VIVVAIERSALEAHMLTLHGVTATGWDEPAPEGRYRCAAFLVVDGVPTVRPFTFSTPDRAKS
jgi:hypothetical protein